ncbi:MAG: hypothetical protein IT371_07540 [Deltaproteobacteria bacterium]|nr:hypothetical protein [Deltaproteobacteria bacterium]
MTIWFCASLAAVGCGSTTPAPKDGGARRDAVSSWDGVGFPDLAGGGDGNVPGDGRATGDRGALGDGPIGPAGMDDVCPPTKAFVTADATLQGSTSKQDISSVCQAGKMYTQVVVVRLTERKKLELKLTSTATMAELSVRPDCKTFKGCSGGEPKNGLKHTATRDPGDHYVVVGTGKPADYSLEIKLSPP